MLIIEALAVNSAKSTNNISGIGRSPFVYVSARVCCSESSGVIISAVRRWLYSGHLYKVCRDSFVTEAATETRIKFKFLSLPTFEPLSHVFLIPLLEAWMAAV